MLAVSPERQQKIVRWTIALYKNIFLLLDLTANISSAQLMKHT